jgi:hypothetical protein
VIAALTGELTASLRMFVRPSYQAQMGAETPPATAFSITGRLTSHGPNLESEPEPWPPIRTRAEGRAAGRYGRCPGRAPLHPVEDTSTARGNPGTPTDPSGLGPTATQVMPRDSARELVTTRPIGSKTSYRQGATSHQQPGVRPDYVQHQTRERSGLTWMSDSFSASRHSTEGRVYTLTGGDWDQVIGGDPVGEERIVMNLGPQHPATHGVLRLVLELEGESVTDCRVVVGYLHTGIEKNVEYRTWTQGVQFLTRADYLSPLFNETVYCLGVEKLLGVTAPPRAQLIRILMMEINRVASHWVWLATGGMELGALTAMTNGFRARERCLDVLELITGLR